MAAAPGRSDAKGPSYVQPCKFSGCAIHYGPMDPERAPVAWPSTECASDLRTQTAPARTAEVSAARAISFEDCTVAALPVAASEVA